MHRKDTSQLHLEDIVMVAAMGPPGGGRNHVTHRFLRHFNLLGIDTFDQATMKSIFTPIMDWHLNQGFPNSMRRFSKASAISFAVAVTDAPLGTRWCVSIVGCVPEKLLSHA